MSHDWRIHLSLCSRMAALGLIVIDDCIVLLDITFFVALVAVVVRGVIVALAEEREHHWQEDESVEEAEDDGQEHNLGKEVRFITKIIQLFFKEILHTG